MTTIQDVRSYAATLRRFRERHGEDFSASSLDPRFVPYFESGQRIRVRALGMVKTGTVGITTGWRPSFLLILTSRSLGSSWLLGDEARILAVKCGRKWVPVND